MDTRVESPDGNRWLGQAVPDSLVVTSANGAILSWNSAAEQLYGYPSGEALGRNIDELLATHHPHGLAHIDTAVAETGTWQGEVFRTAADGRSLGVKSRITRLSEASERAEWSRAFTSEDFAGDSAHRYVNLFNAMAASFWELDFSRVREELGRLHMAGVANLPQHLLDNSKLIDKLIARVRVLDVNQKTLDLFEIGEKHVALGDTIEWAWPPQSREVFARSLIAALKRDDHFSVETVLRSRTGRLIDVLFTVCWPEDHKAQGSVLVGVIDLSETKRAFRELQESEQHYRDLFENMPVALLRIELGQLNDWLQQLSESGIEDLADHLEANPQLIEVILRHPRVVDANSEALDLFGAERLDQLEGPVDWAWRDRPGTLRRSLVARLRGALEFSEETRINLLDGSAIDVLYVISFTQDQVDRGHNIVALVDISERKLAEEELRSVREELSHASRISMLGEMSASIAHEVNQPLAAIAALADASLRWLDRPQPDIEEVRALAVDIASDARRASGIISRIRLLAVKQTAPRGLVDLVEMTRESLLLLRRDFETREIELKKDLGEGPASVSGDRIQLQQVIVNLLVNAMQAMDQVAEDSRTISVTITPDGADYCELVIADSGPGIAAENLPRLFDSFFTTKGTGMGLGLSVCKSIVEAHDGTIAAENHASGARFVIRLPLA
ncbi:PAS domain-containing sensor histidine kinase [Aurantiacibacter hainanensis]|uniref:PAS domain-containing sensor histidine kinase n=1 Tax=Aurantiacibacter hainanensis TaxID=3076114 RepID=UPI0030C709F1